MRTNGMCRLCLAAAIILVLVAVNAPSTTAQEADEIIASEFFSDGDLIQGWYWLRDAAHGQTADWPFTSLPPGTADIELRFEVLATDRASGLPGIDANFYLSYGVPPSGQMGGVLFDRLRITLENQPVPRDLTGYFCLGSVTIPREALHDAQGLWIHVSRADELGELAPIETHVAFNRNSIRLASAPAAGEGTLVGAQDFETNGDWIDGWYWLRDDARQQVARWQFATSSLPAGGAIVLDVTALATNTFSGGPGYPADFVVKVLDQAENTLAAQSVHLENAAPPGDTLGYLCHGVITLPGVVTAGDHFYILIVRDATMSNHVAFNRDSVQLAGLDTGATLADTDTLDAAIILQPGTYRAELGLRLADGSRDSEDWYALDVQQGQIITIQLVMTQDTNFGLSLREPGGSSSRGSVVTDGDVRTLQYVAGVTGFWSVRITRNSGEGPYQLIIRIENQDDAGSGGDAGDSAESAVPVVPGSYTGFLLENDDYDWFAFDVVAGQLVNAQLSSPPDTRFLITLRNPSGSSEGSPEVVDGSRVISYAADATGVWFWRVQRDRGSGDYTLTFSVDNQDDAGSGRDAGDSRDAALTIPPGTHSGYLQDNDDEDWYAINVTSGQRVTVALASQPEVRLGLSLRDPSGQSKGTATLSGGVRSVDIIANATGLWTIRVGRDQGAGTYQLTVSFSG